ncbi:hotdog domain-containing protein [Dactylosporangium sp. NPDC050688]|uniref:thioesterase family protein n=1 Tax=Dactylosporangium sp. NPDC050688 TaxID=3157217 RepID=UPI0033C8753C
MPISGTRRLTVAPEDSASRWGNPGVEVLSTPAILGHVESLCADLLEPHLAPGEMSVGVQVVMNHRAPARIGDEVLIEALAAEAGPRPRFEFRVRGANGSVLCDGDHRRAVVAVAQFRARLAE